MIETVVASGIRADARGGQVAQENHAAGNEEGKSAGNQLVGTHPEDDDIKIQAFKDLKGRLAKAAFASGHCSEVDNWQIRPQVS